MDPFETLGLAAHFDIDAGQLEARYRELLKTLHPDKHVRASGAERRESMSRAVSVNEAYRVLKDELKRAQALLERLGVKADEKAGGSDPELLMEVMELREALAEARAEGNLPAAQELGLRVREREDETRFALRRALDAGSAARSDEALASAARALSRMRYYRRFRDEVTAFEDDANG